MSTTQVKPTSTKSKKTKSKVEVRSHQVRLLNLK